MTTSTGCATLVTRLTERHEAGIAEPWSVIDAPAAFIEGQLRAIVGVELVISRIEAKAKLSQNRPAADRAAVVEALGSLDAAPAIGPDVAALMREHLDG